MHDFDIALLWILAALGLLNALLRIFLAKKQGAPLSRFWTLELFVFPLLLGIALVLYQAGTADVVFPLVMLGLLEEILCIFLRRKAQKTTQKPEND